MNTRMWENGFVQGNIDLLRDDRWQIIEPVNGLLACGTLGKGKLMSTRPLVDKIVEIMNED